MNLLVFYHTNTSGVKVIVSNKKKQLLNFSTSITSLVMLIGFSVNIISYELFQNMVNDLLLDLRRLVGKVKMVQIKRELKIKEEVIRC